MRKIAALATILGITTPVAAEPAYYAPQQSIGAPPWVLKGGSQRKPSMGAKVRRMRRG